MRSTTTLAALCAVTALALTACGSDDDKGDTGKSGQTASASSKATPSEATKAAGSELEKLTGPQIANKAMKAMKSAKSLTTDLDGIVDGSPMKYHMSSDSKGECVGNMSFGAKGGKVELIKTGDLVYMKFDRAFWKSQGGADGAVAADTIGDRWTKSKASGSDFKDFATACDSDAMLAGFEGGPNLSRKGETTTVDGKPAITLTETEGDERYTIYVATEGKPYVLKMVTKGGKEPGTVTFSDIDKPVDAKAPTGDIVDLDALG